MKAMQLDHDMLLRAARMMESEGGSFAGHIARAFYVADLSNREKLLSAFDELFVQFYKKHMRDVRNREMNV
ncbi:MAG: hypothetical protein EBW87_03020 [Burkholderiaceae bacterium]|jgi:hypothetical protein|nr:hypothetical protein [Burkholderiaceae bacterium]